MEKQRTLKKTVEFSGIGLHTGAVVEMVVRPADAGEGIVFSYNGVKIPANASSVGAGARNTSLTFRGAVIHTVEHVLSALYGAGVDNALIELSAEEPPAMDGSALPFFKAFTKAGTRAQELPRKIIAPQSSIIFEADDSTLSLLPADNFRITYLLEYPHPLIQKQIFKYEFDTRTYGKEVAPARTFALFEEVKYLRERGLAKGGSIDNAVVFNRDSTSTPLRFPNEPARHKTLDLIGDLALAGARIKGRIIADKTGHAQNQKLAKALYELMDVD